ncbi:MAG TPA: CBS domain-containing protein [candidate division Zixibacteria bacterium]|nr:CBS domain-containing protein [candidate division Zixibacteria bacterium]
MSIRIRNIMVREVITTRRDSTLEEAVKLMNEHEIGCLIVTENNEPIGILTERDLLKRILAKSKDLKRMKVEEVMSTPLISVEPNAQLGDVSRLMFEKNIKKMPIVKKGELLGLVTLTDVLRIQPQLIKMYKIFSNGLAPRRIKKVFDYYLLVDNKIEVQTNSAINLSPKKIETM